jgi:hypothetical protein
LFKLLAVLLQVNPEAGDAAFHGSFGYRRHTLWSNGLETT